MEPNTRSIILLAWSRALGLDDDALREAGPRTYHRNDEATTLQFVELFGASVLTGPRWALERADHYTDAQLARGEALRALAERPADASLAAGPAQGLRHLSSAVLAHLDDYTREHGAARSRPPLVSHEDSDVRAVEGQCPPDDVNEAAMDLADVRFTLLDDDQKQLACAGYRVHHGFLADTRWLTGAAVRRSGHGLTTAGLTVNDALDSGLIPQARIPRGNVAGRHLATALGFEETGHLSAIALR